MSERLSPRHPRERLWTLVPVLSALLLAELTIHYPRGDKVDDFRSLKPLGGEPPRFSAIRKKIILPDGGEFFAAIGENNYIFKDSTHLDGSRSGRGSVVYGKGKLMRDKKRGPRLSSYARTYRIYHGERVVLPTGVSVEYFDSANLRGYQR